MDRVVHHFARSSLGNNDRGSHYIDWSGDCASPKVLLEEDLEALLASSCLFARKFSEARSARLLTMLERQIGEK